MDFYTDSFTNSSLTTARACLRKYYLRYPLRLERDVAEEDRETLAVGSCWHAAHDSTAPYEAINRTAPSPLWAEKLKRLFAGQAWYWASQPIAVERPEFEFEVTVAGVKVRGKIDGIIVTPDGRRGILERKTTSSGVEAESDYWRRLRLDTQVGIYGAAFTQLFGKLPDFIVYDVVRKPTSNPKALAAAEVKRMRAELAKAGAYSYFGELFFGEAALAALDEAREDDALYGARLTADIGDRPAYYFARREVPRTAVDYDGLQEDVACQVEIIRHAEARDLFPRNPDACSMFGLCEYFSLCEQSQCPTASDTSPPRGFRQRDKLHPELS
jgi:hypothetical protein